MSIPASKMPRRYYNAHALERTLQSFEQRFDLPTHDFFEAHQAEEDDSSLLSHVPRFERHVWASLYAELRRLNGDDFAERAERELELA